MGHTLDIVPNTHPASLQRRLRPYLVILTLIILILVLAAPFFPVAMWIGRTNIPLAFIITDLVSGQPVPHASVRLIHPRYQTVKNGRTGSDGRVAINNDFQATGRKGRFENSGSVNFLDWWVEVSAPGFRTARFCLTEFIAPSRDLHAAPPAPVSIVLQPDAAATSGPLATLAGDYFWYDGETGYSLRIEADGRFNVTGRNNMGVYNLTQGTGSIVDGGLVLSPTGSAGMMDPESFDNLMDIVRWNDRIYLIADESRRSFTDDIATGNDPWNLEFGAYPLRDGDRGKSVTGRPPVPLAWLQPRQAKVIAISKTEAGRIRLRINRGKQSGMCVGMVLCTAGNDPREAKVVEVDEGYCTAEVIGAKVGEGDIAVGSELTEKD